MEAFPGIEVEAAALEVHSAVQEALLLVPGSAPIESINPGSCSESSPSPLTCSVSSSCEVAAREGDCADENGRRFRRKTDASGYERRRAARRVDRAVEALECALNSLENDSSLADGVTSDLVSILTSLPSALLSESSQQDLVVGTTGNAELYRNCSRAASRLLVRYAVLPLGDDHVDHLLDRVAALCLEITTAKAKQKKGLRTAADHKQAALYPVLTLLNASLWHSHRLSLDQNQNRTTKDVDNPLHFLFFSSLSLVETKKLCELLVRKALHDLNNRWCPPPLQSEADDCTQLENHESLFESRMLIQYLLRHFFAALKSDQKTDIHTGDNANAVKDFSEVPNWPVTTKIPGNNSTLDDTLLADFAELLKSYLVEVVEYALDAIEGASSHHRSSVLRQQQEPQDERLENNDANDTNDKNDTLQILQDAIRHVSLAINMIEIPCQQQNNVLQITCPSSTLVTLFTAYTNFVSSLSHQDEESEQGGITPAADDLLIRLAKIIQNETTFKHIQDTKDELKTAQILSFLRILGSYGVTDETEFLLPRHVENEEEDENPIADGGVTHILQAAAVTSLMLPEIPPLGNIESEDVHQQRQVGHIAKALLENTQKQKSWMDPWHSLVARKMAESIQVQPCDDLGFVETYVNAVQSSKHLEDVELSVEK